MAPVKVLNDLALMANQHSVAWARTLMTVVGGLLAGIIGVQGLAGFAIYFFITFITSLALLIPMKFQPADYFAGSPTPVGFLVSGAFDNVLLYIVAWAAGFGVLWVF